MLFVNQKSVKYPELLTAVVLSQTFYRDTSLYVGDKEKVTDIYSRGKTIGIEVVQSEYASDFLLSSFSNLYQKQMEQKGNPLPKRKAKVLSWSYNTEVDDDIVMEQFRARIVDKLGKLNNGNYAKIKSEVNLAVLSYMRVKSKEDAQNFIDAYKEESVKFEREFNKIFLIFSTGIYYLDDGEIVAYAEFVGDDFLHYQEMAKAIMKNGEKQVF